MDKAHANEIAMARSELQCLQAAELRQNGSIAAGVASRRPETTVLSPVAGESVSSPRNSNCRTAWQSVPRPRQRKRVPEHGVGGGQEGTTSRLGKNSAARRRPETAWREGRMETRELLRLASRTLGRRQQAVRATTGSASPSLVSLSCKACRGLRFTGSCLVCRSHQASGWTNQWRVCSLARLALRRGEAGGERRGEITWCERWKTVNLADDE